MAAAGAGRMPPVGVTRADAQGLRLVAGWVRSLAPAEGGKPSSAAGRRRADLVRTLCAPEGGGEGAGGGGEHRAAIDELLGSASGALALALALEEGALAGEARRELAEGAALRDGPHVRSLLRGRLAPGPGGASFDRAAALASPGDPERGRRIFFDDAQARCGECHAAAGRGGRFGPELSEAARKGREALLESILRPAAEVAPAYVVYALTTKRGELRSGIIVERGAREVVLREAPDREVRVRAEDVAELAAQPGSAMPESLLAGRSAQDIADLLAFIESQRREE